MRSPIAALLPLSLVVLGALAPDAASACSMCLASQSEATRYAFLWTTGFLSVLPVGMIGLAVWWLRRRVREQARQEARAAAGAGDSAWVESGRRSSA